MNNIERFIENSRRGRSFMKIDEFKKLNVESQSFLLDKLDKEHALESQVITHALINDFKSAIFKHKSNIAENLSHIDYVSITPINASFLQFTKDIRIKIYKLENKHEKLKIKELQKKIKEYELRTF